MNGITLWMAFVDAIPVVIFLIANLILMKDFGEDTNEKGLTGYMLFSAGAIMLFAGAILKVAWKTMYALNICDYTTFSESFFPMQTLGFCILTMGLIDYVSKNRKKAKIGKIIFGAIMFAICTFFIFAFSGAAKEGWAPEGTEVFVYESHMPFLLGTLIGFMTMQILLMIIAVKRKSKLLIIAFVISAIFMIVQVFAGSMFSGTSAEHWFAQITNIFAESALLVGALGLSKNKNK